MEKLRKRWKTWVPLAEGFHKQTWPHLEVPAQRIAKKDRNSAKSCGEGMEDLLDEKTIPTTMMLSLLVMFSTYIKRTSTDREKSFNMLRRVASIVCQSSGGFMVEGTKVDQQGLFESEVWPPSLLQELRSLWDADLLCQPNFWVQSHFDRAHVVDCIAFIFRPVSQSSRREVGKWKQLSARIQWVAFKILQALAQSLHEQIRRVTVSQGLKRRVQNEQERELGVKKKRKVASSHENIIMTADIIEKLYTREDTKIWLEWIFLFVFCWIGKYSLVFNQCKIVLMPFPDSYAWGDLLGKSCM